MAYQSIFSGGQLGSVNKGLLTYNAPAPPKFNVNSVKDVPTLNSALHAGHINQQQWMQRFKQIQAQTNAPSIKTGISAVPGFLGNALNKVLVPAPIAVAKSLPQSEKTVAQIGARLLPGGQNDIKAENENINQTNRDRQQINQLVKSGKMSPQVASKLLKSQQQNLQLNSKNIQTTKKSIPTRGQAVSGVLGTAADILTGGTLPELKEAITAAKFANAGGRAAAFGTDSALGTAAAGGTKKQIVKNAIVGATLPLAGEGLAKGAKAAIGKDEATNALINSQKVVNASKRINLADRLGSPTVQEAKTQRVPVINPTETSGARQSMGATALANSDRTSIPVTGRSTQVIGKVTTKADSTYVKASNKLSDQYEKELSSVQSVSHPVTQKVLQDKLDTKYNALQQNLDDSYGKSSVSFKGNPVKAADSGITTPRSALTKNPVTPFDSTRIPEQNPELPSPSVKNSPSAGSTTTDSTRSSEISGKSKISGSALNSESRAVQAGLVKEFPDKATYTGTSYKQDAEDAVKLAHENPEEAQAIASGKKDGRSQAYNVAVRRAVESKANKENDIDTIMKLGNSSGHTRTSEAAQTLGAESYNVHANSPVEAIKQVAAIRKEVGAKKLGKSPVKAIASTVKEIESEPKLQVSRQDWHSFVNDLQCK